MGSNVLLVFDAFDPITNYKLKLAEEAGKIVDFRAVIFSHEDFGSGGDRVFQMEERLYLLSSTLPNSPSPIFLIDGESFTTNQSLAAKINAQKQRHRQDQMYLLLDSREYQILEQRPEWPAIFSSAQIILYVLPEHRDMMNTYAAASQPLLFINPTHEINRLKQASVLEVSRETFSDLLIDYMNRSGECAIKRIKSHLSDKRFKHSLRVAGTIKRICELAEVEDAELCYDAYLAALYHDICKEISMDIQESIATEILDMHDYVSWKSLHGPIGAWYMRTKYLFDNEDILEAVAQHTVPEEYPKRITMLLFLADKLEVDKKERYPADVYDKVWDLIGEKKPVEAFNFLLNFVREFKKGVKEL